MNFVRSFLPKSRLFKAKFASLRKPEGRMCAFRTATEISWTGMWYIECRLTIPAFPQLPSLGNPVPRNICFLRSYGMHWSVPFWQRFKVYRQVSDLRGLHHHGQFFHAKVLHLSSRKMENHCILYIQISRVFGQPCDPRKFPHRHYLFPCSISILSSFC